MTGLKWTDAHEIGCLLCEKFPDVDPLTLRFSDLRKRVIELEGFDDDPNASNEGLLERIQMCWLDYDRET